jgi:signal transduction histidine kinase
MSLKFKVDASIGAVLTSLISVLGYRFITRTRHEKDILSEKFLDVGRHASAIMHDFKGMLSTPVTYVQLLQKGVLATSAASEKERQVLQYLGEDLTYLNRYVQEVNALNHLSDVATRFKLSDLHAVIGILLRGHLRKCVFEVENDAEIYFSRNVLLKAFYNLTLNAIEAGGAVKGLKIRIGYDSAAQAVFIQDNGPGIPKEALQGLNRGQFVQSQKAESGSVGVYLVRELLEQRGAKLLFSNGAEGGARVMVRLPKAAVAVSERAPQERAAA